MSHPPPDVRSILSPEALDRLRASYDSRALITAARAATTAPFPEAAPFLDALLGGFFEGDRVFSPAERELLVIALFTGTTPAWMLAVHIYMGLMEGLCVDKMASAVLLAAMYVRGVAAYTASIAVVERTLVLLRDAAE